MDGHSSGSRTTGQLGYRRRMRCGVTVLLLLASGCLEGGFDGRGDQASVSLAWTIAGADADPRACAARAATTARLVQRADEGRRLDPDLEWSCASGTGASARVFEAATIDFAVELLDPNGAVVAWSPWMRRTVIPGENPLGIFDLQVSAPPPDAAVTIRWRVGGVEASAAACAAAGGATVRLDWRVGTMEGEPFDWPCADGTGSTTAALRSGIETDFRLRLLDADGFTVARAPRGSWTIRTLLAGDNELEPFELATDVSRAPLSALLFWADRVGDGATYVECAGAGVVRLGYRLEDGGGAVVDEVDLGSAPAACSGYLTWAALPLDTYTLIVEGEDETAAASWAAECWGLEVSNPLDNSFVCRVPRLR
jgi:hypothetical protein